MVFYVSLRMSARSRRVQVRGGSAKAVVGRKGRYRAIGEYMTALLLCRTATTGKRGGRQGESTTWVESSSVNVGCGSCWGAGVWRGSDLETQRLKAAAASTEVERADWLLCNVTTHHLLVYRMISEVCRYVRLRPHPHSCPRIEETCST